jgi:hypothetical protein
MAETTLLDSPGSKSAAEDGHACAEHITPLRPLTVTNRDLWILPFEKLEANVILPSRSGGIECC